MIPPELLPQLLGPLGLLVGSLVTIVALQREWVVPGSAFRRQIRETEYWRRLALSSTSLAQKATALAAEKVAQEAPM